MTSKPKKVLIVRLSSLGDVIFTVPLANQLKKNGYEVGWIVSEKGIDIVKNNPSVDHTYLCPLQKWKKKGFSLENFKEFLSILKEVRKEKYNIAIDSQQMFKSLYWMLTCGAKRRITVKGARELADFGGNEHIQNPYRDDFSVHAVEMNYAFARHIGIEPDGVEFTLPLSDDDTIKKVDNLLSNLDNTKPVVVICPATTWRLKHWDKDNWKEVVKYLENKCSLIFSGTEKDKDLLSYIGGDNHINLAGKTNVKDLIEIFRRADLVIAPDSGSAHVAWATGKPAVISIFTCTPPSLYGAYGNKDKYFAVNGNLECQPCFTKSCPKLKDKDKCLKHPTPQEIINIVNKVFNFAENVV